MNSARITYAPRPDTAPEAELGALAAVFRFVIDRANRNAPGMTRTNGGDVTMKNNKGVSHVDQRTS